MKKSEIIKIYKKITVNEMRPMEEERFVQAVQEIADLKKCSHCASFSPVLMDEKIIFDGIGQIFGDCSNINFHKYIFHKHAVNGEFGCIFHQFKKVE